MLLQSIPIVEGPSTILFRVIIIFAHKKKKNGQKGIKQRKNEPIS